MSQQALPQTSHYSGDDVKIIDKSSGYNGFFKVNVYRLQHRSVSYTHLTLPTILLV